MIHEEDFRLVHEDDVIRIGLENELLSFEVEVLRAKLSNFDALLAEKEEAIVERNRMVSERNSVIKERNATIGKRDRTIADLRSHLDQDAELRKDQVLIAREDYEDLKKARRDLRWTLDRLGKTPLVGHLIRRRAGFAQLIDRYLSE